MILALLLLVASPVPAESRQLVLSISESWDTPAAHVRRYERANARRGPGSRWAPTSPHPWAGQGLAWGRGLHSGSFRLRPRSDQARGRRQVARRRLRSASRHRLRCGRTVRNQAPLSRGHADPPLRRRHRARRSTTSSWTRRRSRRTGRRPRTCGGPTTSTGSWCGWGTTTRRSRRAGGAASSSTCARRPTATTAGCTAFDTAPMEALLRWLDPARRPVLVQLPEPAYRALAPAWGLP